jgi:hypothetical protein
VTGDRIFASGVVLWAIMVASTVHSYIDMDCGAGQGLVMWPCFSSRVFGLLRIAALAVIPAAIYTLVSLKLGHPRQGGLAIAAAVGGAALVMSPKLIEVGGVWWQAAWI